MLQTTLPDIRDGKRLLTSSARSTTAKDKIRLIVNRYEKGGKLRLQDLEAAFGAEHLHTIPNHYVAVTDSVNQGVPVLQLARSSPDLKGAAGIWRSRWRRRSASRHRRAGCRACSARLRRADQHRKEDSP